MQRAAQVSYGKLTDLENSISSIIYQIMQPFSKAVVLHLLVYSFIPPEWAYNSFQDAYYYSQALHSTGAEQDTE